MIGLLSDGGVHSRFDQVWGWVFALSRVWGLMSFVLNIKLSVVSISEIIYIDIHYDMAYYVFSMMYWLDLVVFPITLRRTNDEVD